MTHVCADRVRETTTTTGTGIYTLAGAVLGFQRISAALTADFDTGFFTITNGTDWENILGTRQSATTLSRTTIFSSSNANAAVNWAAGIKEIFLHSTPAFFAEHLNTQEVTVASAATTDIGAVNTRKVEISGTTTITSLGTSANKLRIVRFSGALVLTHNGTSLILPDATNITTAAGDTAIFASDSSGNWKCYHYQRTANVFKAPTRQVFTSGSGTYNTPAGAQWLDVELVGGGGGGRGSGTGAGVSAGNGGSTTFSTLTGSGGTGAGILGGGAGGAASGGDINQTGGKGGNVTGTNTNQPGGNGGSSALGSQGGAGATAAAGNAGATNSGSGGGGAGDPTSTATSGAGGGGGGYVRARIQNPGVSFSFSVGAAGTAGTAGASGFAGGAGGSGLISVTEYYGA